MNIGDVVHLKSDGVMMTVSAVETTPGVGDAPETVSVVTVWHADNGTPHTERHDARVLEMAGGKVTVAKSRA